jgi:thioredoxin-dependent peroxiredoxin
MIRKFDVQYFMISVDTPEDNKRFAEQEHADFPMLSDPSKATATKYGVLSPPNPDRPDQPQLARRWTFYIGPDGKILDIDKTPGTQKAAENMLAKLQSLGIKQK